MRWSIRYQLLVPLAILLLGVAGVSSWTAFASGQRAWQQLETQVRNVARIFSQAHYPLTDDVLRQTAGLSGAEYVLLRSDDRRHTTLIDADSPSSPSALAEVWETLTEQLPAPEGFSDDWQTLQLSSRITVQGKTYLCSGFRLSRPGPNMGGRLYILYPDERWRDALWEAIRPSLLLGGFVGLASVALAVGVGQRLSRRIQELERRTRQIAAGDFSRMPLSGRNDELRDLGQSVNDMAQRLAQLQEAVQKTERLRLLGQLSGGLAHQLRNGVTGAILAVQLHARDCKNGADPEALDVALRQLTLLESNLKRFLDLGRSEGMRKDLCSLVSLVSEAVALLRPQCRHAQIELRWQPPHVPMNLLADSGQLGHMLVNVLGNAVEAAGPGGWVQVELQIADCRLQNEEKSALCIIEVIDSGPGPAPEVAARLFEPFVTSKNGGVGLGLAVARQVVEAHGGRIIWRREVDRTCFRIELPLMLPTAYAMSRRDA